MAIINGKQVPLEEYNKQFRTEELAKNKYGNNNQYTEGHPDALSDGDELGKGELNGSVGSKTDIEQRKKLLSKNIYSPNNPYDSSKV